MSIREFILSDKRWHRLGRHLLFWVFWGGYFSLVRYFNPLVYMTTGRFPDLLRSVAEGIFFLLPQTFLVYPLLYFVLPKYIFKHKYLKGVLWGLFFFILSMFIHAIILLYIPWDKVPWISTSKLFLTTDTFPQKVLMAYLASFQGALTGAALAASFKMFKHYYLKNLRNHQLVKENSEAQLRLLMAQVHPHFMFNTLNNIYSQAQIESPRSAKMILELSHIMRYVIDEGKKSKVPLESELQLIVDYLNLEKVRYDTKLDLHYSFPNDVEHLQIAPLLLLPLVENCFKHGASKMINNPWINIKAEIIDDSTFLIKLMNGKKTSTDRNNIRVGTGLENVQHRLNLLYHNNHTFNITDEEDVFIVNLSIELDKDLNTHDRQKPAISQEYA